MVFTWLHIGILLFLAMGAAFGIGSFLIAHLISSKAKGGDLGIAYECGVRPQGSPWIRFGVNYYIYAILFLAFDVDVLYLFPVSIYYPEADGLLPFVKVFIFLAILGLAIVYFWAKGVFKWPKKLS